jgi:hypothetical protein
MLQLLFNFRLRAVQQALQALPSSTIGRARRKVKPNCN